ncbi:MAG: hypothetical protein JW847_05640 [Candidatus Omnitrophica bacterium]|nr:hypothetical protein [Candidatus Omnitrophota bacterium]
MLKIIPCISLQPHFIMQTCAIDPANWLTPREKTKLLLPPIKPPIAPNAPPRVVKYAAPNAAPTCMAAPMPNDHPLISPGSSSDLSTYLFPQIKGVRESGRYSKAAFSCSSRSGARTNPVSWAVNSGMDRTWARPMSE